MPSYINVPAAIDEAKVALAERDKAMQRVDVVRTDLRNAVEFGDTTPEQRDWITETFPVRHRKPVEEQAKLAAERAAQLAEKAAKSKKAGGK